MHTILEIQVKSVSKSKQCDISYTVRFKFILNISESDDLLGSVTLHNSLKNKTKHPVSGSFVGGSILLREIWEEQPDWFKLTVR